MWSMMWSLWKKDFKTYMADRQAIFTIFLMPVVISTILGFSLQSMFGTAGGVSQIEPFELAVVKSYEGVGGAESEHGEGVGGVTIGRPYGFEAFMEDLAANPVGARVAAEMSEDQLRGYFEDVDPEAIFFEDLLGVASGAGRHYFGNRAWHWGARPAVHDGGGGF